MVQEWAPVNTVGCGEITPVSCLVPTYAATLGSSKQRIVIALRTSCLVSPSLRAERLYGTIDRQWNLLELCCEILRR